MSKEKLKKKPKRILNYKILFLLFLLYCQTKIDLETDSIELYNLKEDLGETINLRYCNKLLTQDLKLKDWKLSIQVQCPLSNSRYIEN